MGGSGNVVGGNVAAQHPLLPAIHEQTQSGALTPLEGQRIAHALGGNPSRVPILCEVPGCPVVRPLEQMYSIVMCYATFPAPADTPEHATPFTCPNEQHYGCTHEHAVAAAIACLQGGHMPTPDQVVAARTAAAEL